MLVLDSEDDTDHPIACSTVHQHADPNASTCEDCNEPPEPVLEGVEEGVAVESTTCKVTGSDKWKQMNDNNLPNNNNIAGH